MKPMLLVNAILALGLVVAAPTMVAVHVGHGDKFQAEGGIDRVPVKAEMDAVLGIEVTPIESAVDGSAAVLIPATALVEADGQQLVFVQYENFYEPVPVTLGATQGEQVEVTKGLSVGEKLVTQGGLSLYAESRKTQNPAASPSPMAVPQTEQAHAQAHAQGTAHSHSHSSGLPMKALAAAGGGVVLVGGAIAIAVNRKNKGTAPQK